MKTQRITFFVLAVCFLITVPLVLCAATQDATVSATAIAANSPTYEMTIPPTIRSQELYRTTGSDVYSQAFEMTISEVEFLNGRRLCVRLYSDTDAFVLRHATEDAELPFAVYGPMDPQTPMKNGDVFAYFTTAGTQTGYLCVDRQQITVAGTYSGSIHFAVSVADGE